MCHFVGNARCQTEIDLGVTKVKLLGSMHQEMEATFKWLLCPFQTSQFHMFKDQFTSLLHETLAETYPVHVVILFAVDDESHTIVIKPLWKCDDELS